MWDLTKVYEAIDESTVDKKVQIVYGKKVGFRSLVCPKCGGEVEHDGMTNLKYDPNEHYTVAQATGHCITCGAKYKWEECFEFIGITELEEA